MVVVGFEVRFLHCSIIELMSIVDNDTENGTLKDEGVRFLGGALSEHLMKCFVQSIY